MSLITLSVSVFFTLSGVIFAAADSCTAPNGQQGTCITVRSCPFVLELIRSRENAAYIRQFQCGFEGGTPAVCCPTSTAATPQKLVPSLPPVERIEPIEHALLPDKTLCGLQLIKRKMPGLPENATQIQEQPWIAALYYIKDNGIRGEFKCSGSLISSRYVLTAARCLLLPGHTLTGVRLGEWRFSTDSDCVESSDPNQEECSAPLVEVSITEKIIHVYYNSTTGANDIGLVRLGKDVGFTKYVRPICLPPSSLQVPQPGASLVTSGWGLTQSGARSDVKLKMELSVVNPEECTKTPNNALVTGPCIQRVGNSGFCNGESGSPVIKMYDRLDEDDIVQWYQEGIIYKGLGCRHSSGIFTRVSKYVNWILNNLKP